jgi:hypothetical protein
VHNPQSKPDYRTMRQSEIKNFFYQRSTRNAALAGGIGIVDEAATAPLSNDATYYGT